MNARSHTYTNDGGQRVVHYEACSRIMQPVTWLKDLGEYGREWANGAYYGTLRRYESGSPFGGGEYALLSITAEDESARHDWRDFMQLKNLVVGEEWEALEMYPSESRLVDTSNRFFLWCFPPGTVPWGLPVPRLVLDMEEADAPQRPFPRSPNRGKKP